LFIDGQIDKATYEDQRKKVGTELEKARAQRVETQRPVHLQAPGVDPGEERRRDVVTAQRHLEKEHDAEDGGDADTPAGDDLRSAIGEPAAEEAGDERAQKRQEDGSDRHRISPS
jgi:hypothetical protein